MCVVVCVCARVTAFPDSNVQSVFFCSTEKKIAQYITAYPGTPAKLVEVMCGAFFFCLVLNKQNALLIAAYPGTPAKLVEGSTGRAVLFAGRKEFFFLYPGTPAKLVEGSTGGAVLFAGKEGAAYVLRTTPHFKLLVSKKERGWGGG